MKSVLNITQKAGKQLIQIAEQHKTKSLYFMLKEVVVMVSITR